jgi:hypothetical protein
MSKGFSGYEIPLLLYEVKGTKRTICQGNKAATTKLLQEARRFLDRN